MKHVVIITPAFDCPSDYIARSIKTLAEAYANRGVRTTVYSLVGADSQPLSECLGCLSIHRIEPPTLSAMPGFAVRAISSIAELNHSAPIDAIECFDVPECIAAAYAARMAGVHTATLVSVSSRLGVSELSCLADHHIYASQAVRAGERTNTSVIPLPIPQSNWAGPDTASPAIVVPVHIPAEQYEAISAAYAASMLEQHGWTLAVSGYNGGWMLSSENTTDRGPCPAGAPARRILVVPNDEVPAHLAARQAIASGHTCVVSTDCPLAAHIPASAQSILTYDYSNPHSLHVQLKAAANTTRPQQSELDSALRTAAEAYPSTDRIAGLHTDLWSSPRSPRSTAGVLKAWNSIERACTSSGSVLQETK